MFQVFEARSSSRSITMIARAESPTDFLRISFPCRYFSRTRKMSLKSWSVTSSFADSLTDSGYVFSLDVSLSRSREISRFLRFI